MEGLETAKTFDSKEFLAAKTSSVGWKKNSFLSGRPADR